MAKVDVLLTYWGDVDLLKKAVESVLAQTEPDWHLYVFDDCYPSKEPARYFAKLKDRRITYYRHKKNIGITKNFNYAIKTAKAKYCCMLGCDDIMLPNYLERALTNIGNADFYQPYVDVIDADGNIYLPLGDRIKRMLQPQKAGVYAGEKLAASLCTGNWLYFPSILWRTKVIKKHEFDNTRRVVQDVPVELSIIKDGGTLYFDKSTTFQYRRFKESVSSAEKSKGGVRFNEEEEVYNDFSKEFSAMGWQSASRSAKWHLTSRLHRIIAWLA